MTRYLCNIACICYLSAGFLSLAGCLAKTGGTSRYIVEKDFVEALTSPDCDFECYEQWEAEMLFLLAKKDLDAHAAGVALLASTKGPCASDLNHKSLIVAIFDADPDRFIELLSQQTDAGKRQVLRCLDSIDPLDWDVYRTRLLTSNPSLLE